MNIIASLALSQVKKKKTRAMASILAIALSTALTTTVNSFLASIHAYLVSANLYQGYGAAYMSMLAIPAILVGSLIFMMSVVVISNVFRVSANDRISQFGTLKCVGATAKQITGSIMYESLFLSAIAIPLGIVVGLLITYFGVIIANSYFEQLNSLVRMMMNEFTIQVEFVFSWTAILISAMIALFTVLFSAYRPAKKASRISAMECIRNSGDFSSYYTKKKIRPMKQVGNMEAQLAWVNIHRSKNGTNASVVALSISIILFISLSGLLNVAKGLEYMVHTFEAGDVVVDYVSDWEHRENPVTGRREVYYYHTIDNKMAEEVTKKLAEYGGSDVLGQGYELYWYYTKLSKDNVTAQMLAALEYEADLEQPVYVVNATMIMIDQKHYEEICKQAGVEPGATILINYYQYNHKGTLEGVVPFPEGITSITLESADGTATEISIDAVMYREQLPDNLFAPNMNPVQLIVPDMDMRGYEWHVNVEDQNGFMEYASNVMEEFFPQGDLDYMEAGFTTRVFLGNDYMSVLNFGVGIVSFFLYSFVIILALIGVISVINTMSTNIKMREREFAVLRSIGMTAEDLKKMLNVESFLCTGKALLISIPTGVLIVCCIYHSAKMIFPMTLHLPWAAIALVILVVFALIWGTIRFSAKQIEKQNIIETIRVQ